MLQSAVRSSGKPSMVRDCFRIAEEFPMGVGLRCAIKGHCGGEEGAAVVACGGEAVGALVK
jgi:hypothetical protein